MKNYIIMLALVLSSSIFCQNKKQDTTKVEKLDEVLVRAVRVKAKSPITHSNLSKEQLEKRNLGQDIPILLNFLPSVVTTSDAGAGIGYTGIRVRGVSAQSTNITINGIPYNDAESLGTFWVDLPDFSSSVENLQLQRGVGTSTNGSGAFGASINVLTDAVSEVANGEIANAFGSYHTRKHTLKFSTGVVNNHFEIAGRLSKINSDGYIDRANSDLKSYFLQGAFKNDHTFIKALVFGGHEITYQAWNGIDANTLMTNRRFNPSGMYTDENGQVKFHENEEDNYKQDHFQLHWNERFNKNWSSNIGLNYTHGRGYFEQYKEDEDFANYNFEEITFGGTTINKTDLIRRRWLANDFYVINASTNFRNNNIDITMGGSFSLYEGDHFGEVIWSRFASNSEINTRYYDGKSKKQDVSSFSKMTYRLNKNWSLYGDLQLRNVTYKTSGTNSDRALFEIDQDYLFFNPKFGLSYELNTKHNLYFSFARANREPNRGDFESNPNILPEQLNDFEIGWRFNHNNFSVYSNIYYMLYNEQLVLTGALDDVGNPIRTNSGVSSRLGLEIEADIQLTKVLAIRPNMTISSNKNKETFAPINGSLINLGKTNISFSPELIASNALILQPKPNFQVTFLSKYVGEQFMGNTDSQISKLESYFVNDLSLTYEITTKKVFKSIVFTGLINNVFGEKYVSNGYYFTYDDDFSNPGIISTIEGAGYYPQATRNFLAGVTLKF